MGKRCIFKRRVSFSQVILVMFLVMAARLEADLDCATVTALVATCSAFIANGTPDPYPGSQCCDAMSTLNMLTEPAENRYLVCSCIMGIISTYNPNATAIATLPGFCGVSLGFNINPSTDCNNF